MQYIHNFMKYIPLLKELVIRDLKVKYRRSFLGFLWSLLNPLLMMLVISAVFSHLFRFDIPNFPIYLLCGQIMFTFFSESTNMAMTSINDGGILLKKVYIPKYIFPISRVISAFVNLLFALVAIVLMLGITHTSITWHIILFPIPLILITLFSIGIGLILSTIAVFFRDIIHLYSVALTALMYLTPIFYPATLLADSPMPFLSIVLKFNPLYHFIEYFRAVILYGYFPTLKENIVCISFSLIVLVIGFYFFYKMQDKFILYV